MSYHWVGNAFEPFSLLLGNTFEPRHIDGMMDNFHFTFIMATKDVEYPVYADMENSVLRELTLERLANQRCIKSQKSEHIIQGNPEAIKIITT